jgi:uncharacterized protein (TIGR03435 family)
MLRGRTIIAFFAISASLVCAQQVKFDAASIHLRQSSEGPFHYNVLPNRLDVENMNLAFLIEDAFDLPEFQVAGVDSLRQAHFDLVATTRTPVSRADMRVLLRNLLTERFHLATHRDTKTMSVFRLEVAAGGPKMQTLESGYPIPNSPVFDKGTFRFTGPMSAHQLAGSLTRYAGKPVIDATGLDGFFRIDLAFAAEGSMSSIESTAPPLSDAIKALGLSLTPAKEDVKILVVDHVDKEPTAN